MFEFIIDAIIQAIGNPLIVAVILGFLPISEIRGAAIYAFSINQPWLIIPAAIANMLVAPVILLFWNIINIPYWGKLILGNRLEGKLLGMGKHYESQGLIAIAVFIGIPLPLTGVYSGTLVAELLGINRKHTVIAAVAGVLISTVLMFLFLGGLKLFFG
jgi:uncharacterized membrane protein